jgi:hypothetical protein
MDALFSLTALASYLGLLIASCLYAVFLERIHHIYHPNWTWATVVGGNTLIIIALVVQVALGVVLSVWAAVVALLINNIVAGSPIIVWQVWGITLRLNQIVAAARER